MSEFSGIIKLLGSQGRQLAAAGYYHKACWGTPDGGSPPLSSIQQTFSTTSAIATFDMPTKRTQAYHGTQPGDSVPQTQIAVLDYIRFTVRVADTSATAMFVAGQADQANRFSSGGFQPIPPELGPIAVSGMNTPSKMPGLLSHFGPIVLNAAGANRLLTHSKIPVKQVAAAPLFLVNDQLFFSFANAFDVTPNSGSASTTGNANPSVYRTNMGPIVIEPGNNWSLLAWFTAITVGVTFEPSELGWWELDPGMF